jgi:2-phosphosulfolactate phosphatase
LIDVALTPAALRRGGLAIVIDVLRATSTITQALAAGYRRVLLADSIEQALGMRAPGRVLAGEVGGLRPAGFDLGNSPSQARRALAPELVLATTNGTPAVVAAARQRSRVLLACLLNLGSVIAFTRAAGGEDLQIVCAGTAGDVALEDVHVAGLIIGALAGELSDSALLAQAAAAACPQALPVLAAAANGRALRAAGLGSDIEDCAQCSTIDLVPEVVEASERSVAVVAAATAARRALGPGWAGAPAAPAPPQLRPCAGVPRPPDPARPPARRAPAPRSTPRGSRRTT